MILTDREIRIAIENGLISISPNPDPSQYSSTSLDLKLDKNLRRFKDLPKGYSAAIDPAEMDIKGVLRESTDTVEIKVRFPSSRADWSSGGQLRRLTLICERELRRAWKARVHWRDSVSVSMSPLRRSTPVFEVLFSLS